MNLHTSSLHVLAGRLRPCLFQHLNVLHYATKDATNERGGEHVPSEVLENMVELVGIEPTTSSLRTMRSPS